MRTEQPRQMVVLHFERMDEVAPSSVCLTGEGVFRRSIKPRAMREIERKQLEQVRHVPVPVAQPSPVPACDDYH